MIQVFHAEFSEEAIAAATRCMRDGWVGYGPRCRDLERHFTDNLGGWALATGSCTSALYLAALLIDHEPDDEVIVPATTFVSTAMAFHWAGWRVRVADVEPETLLVSPRTIAAVMTRRTRAVVAVHLYGQRVASEELATFCAAQDCILIEDCAHRLPLPNESAPAGQFACYSFNAVKEAPAGEGGLLWCADPALETAAREHSNLGLLIDTPQRCATVVHRDYEFGNHGGLKLRLNDIAAALALDGTGRLPATRLRRQNIAARYDQAFAGLATHIAPLPRQPNDSCLMYVARIPQERREPLRHILSQAGVATSVHYPSLSMHPLFLTQGCPVAEQASHEIVTLPLHLGLTEEDQQRVIAAVAGAGCIDRPTGK